MQVVDGSMPQTTLYNRVKNTLYVDSPSLDWDALGWTYDGYLIFFYGKGSTPCNSQPNFDQIEVRYYARASGYCGGLSCSWKDGLVSNYHDGHADWWYGIVGFKTSHVNGSAAGWHHTINHETGHVLGLADPDEPAAGAPHCTDDPNFLTSVEHSDYYCHNGNAEWPNNADRWCAEQLALKTCTAFTEPNEESFR